MNNPGKAFTWRHLNSIFTDEGEIMGLRMRDRLFGNVTSIFRFEHPKQCPEGHRQISWVSSENDVHCWLCDKTYPITQCFTALGESQQTENN
jgi:hypothetical protein